MIEEKLHNLIKNNADEQRKLCDALGIDYDNCRIEFVSEDQFPNSMYVDLTILVNGNVKALIEIKGDDIGINDFVRGTGQIFQYQHFIDLRETVKDYIFDDAYAVYLFPSKIISQGKFNIGLMAFPQKCKIIEYSEETDSFREITKKDLGVLAGNRGKTVTTISQYYIRDTRLFEIYIALKYIVLLQQLGANYIDRNAMEEFLKQLDVPDKGNWRNVFISLSSLGLTDSRNLPTEKGLDLGIRSFSLFAYTIYSEQIKPYVDNMISTLTTLNADVNAISLTDIKTVLESNFGGQEILFMTDSGTRYLSSWLNIMRDDYRCIDFQSGKSNRTYDIFYNPKKYNKKAIMREVSNNEYANKFINDFIQLFKDEYLKKEVA